jgi:hypothetical protein
MRKTRGAGKHLILRGNPAELVGVAAQDKMEVAA